jgi:ATP-dependent Clp protease, protease subunit
MAEEDIYKGLKERLYKSRTLLLSDEVTSVNATELMFALTDLDKQDHVKPIWIYINSPGGDVQAGLTIIDTMKHIEAPVGTVCYSMAASMAAIILAAGHKGMRKALPHSLIMIHQPLKPFGETYLKQSDLKVIADNLTKTRQTSEELLAAYTGQPMEVVHGAIEKDNYMSADDALKFGLIDEIMKPYKAI